MAVSHQRFRDLALGMPGTTEQDHHGRPSFRVAGRIIATLWDAERANIMLDEPGIFAAVEDHPGACREVYWGRRLSAVGVLLEHADDALVRDLLRQAWARRAPAG
ncbi:MAG: MmcQ/YjbR family DNA-binding protein [Thermoleophilia bacterium]